LSSDEVQHLAELKVDTENLYREEMFTDLRVATLRRLVPVRLDGTDDPSRPILFSAQTTLMTQAGPVPVSAAIEAKTLAEATLKFPEAIQAAEGRGDVATAPNPSNGTLALTVSNYLQKGDKVTITIKQATHQVAHVAVTTWLNDPSAAVTLDVAFMTLPNGVSFPSTKTLTAAAKEVVVTITDADFALAVVRAMIAGDAERGILVCGSGAGVAVAAVVDDGFGELEISAAEGRPNQSPPDDHHRRHTTRDQDHTFPTVEPCEPISHRRTSAICRRPSTPCSLGTAD